MREFRSPKGPLYELGGSVCLCLMTAFLLVWAAALLWSRSSLITGLCYLSVIWLFAALPTLALVNLYPSIWLTDQGLSISYNIVRRVNIPWRDVLDVTDSVIPGYGTRVYARRITLLHRLYGGWLRYAFIVAPDIPDREDLIAEIRRHLRHD